LTIVICLDVKEEDYRQCWIFKEASCQDSRKKESKRLPSAPAKPKVSKKVLPKSPLVVVGDPVKEKRPTQTRFYPFTINNYRKADYDEDSDDTIEAQLSKLCYLPDSNILYIVLVVKLLKLEHLIFKAILSLKRKVFSSRPNCPS